MKEIEVWKRIEDFDDYEVSNLGAVYSIRTGKILSLSEDRKGYSVVHLYRNGYRSNKKVHRLVAEAFIPNPDNLPEVDHINGNRKDNRVHKLRWVSSSVNTRNRDACRNAASQYNGVYKDRRTGKWYTRVWVEDKLVHLGTFIEETEAARAFNQFCIELSLSRELNHITE